MRQASKFLFVLGRTFPVELLATCLSACYLQKSKFNPVIDYLDLPLFKTDIFRSNVSLFLMRLIHFIRPKTGSDCPEL